MCTYLKQPTGVIKYNLYCIYTSIVLYNCRPLLDFGNTIGISVQPWTAISGTGMNEDYVKDGPKAIKVYNVSLNH